MKDDLPRLVRLQGIMQSIEDLKGRITAIPAEVARLEKDQLAAEGRLDAERAEHQDSHKEKRRLEVELMAVESRIVKYQAQLHEVKTNKEYQAMLHEIEACRAERAALDEKILLEMESADSHAAALKTREQEVAAIRARTAEGKTRLAEQETRLKDEIHALEQQGKEISGQIARTHLEPFLKVARQRKGLALVAVRDGLCGGCNVRVLPKLVQMVRRAEGLIACDSCKRFLYVLDEPGKGGTAPAPGVAGPDPADTDGAGAEGAATGDATAR